MANFKINVGLDAIKQAHEARMKAQGINLTDSQRFTGTFEKIRDTKLGATYALVALATEQEGKEFLAYKSPEGKKLTEADYVVNLQAIEEEELLANGGVCKFYIGHPSLLDAAGKPRIGVNNQPILDKNKFILRLELKITEALRANNITAGKMREIVAEDNREAAKQLLLQKGNPMIDRILAKMEAAKNNETQSDNPLANVNVSEIASRPRITT